jgi:predicted aspartyl protease
MLILGSFDEYGNAIISIQVAGDSGSKIYSAIIDTGFSGFVALPLIEMIDLGLSTQGAANVTLGDGSVISNLVSTGTVTLGAQIESGTILLDETSTDILVGMAFLREFKMALILTNSAVVLYDEHETVDAVARFMGTAPQGQPNTTPSATS